MPLPIPYQSWLSYTPTWGGTGSNPAIGNGTIAGKYSIIGKTVIYSVTLTMGGTTTYGTGDWTFTLPVTAATTVLDVGSAWAFDNGTAYFIGNTLTKTSTTLWIFNHNAGGAFSSSNPHTWASTDQLIFTHKYEAA